VDFAPRENRRSAVPSEEVGDTGAPNRLGFFGLIGGAGLRLTAADVADDIERTDGEGDSEGRVEI
jgi:hypothetical protein